MPSRLLFGLMALFSISISFAQTRVIEGKVVQQENGKTEPVVWAIIRLGATGPGVATNEDGDFKLSIPVTFQDSLISVSAMGFISQNGIKASQFKATENLITLQQSNIQVAEVLITPKNTGFQPNEDGKWQNAFFREYFLREGKTEYPLELLEAEYTFKRVKPKNLTSNVYILKSRALERFGKIKLSSPRAIIDVWLSTNVLMKLYYDSLIIKESAEKKTIQSGQDIQQIETYHRTTKSDQITYHVTRNAKTGDVLEITYVSTRLPNLPDNKRTIGGLSRLFTGKINYVLNLLEDKVTYQFNQNGVPVFAQRDLKIFLSFEKPEFGESGNIRYITQWLNTGEVPKQPSEYQFKWTPSTALYKQVLKRDDNFWSLSNTILPTEKERRFLKELIGSK